MPTHSRIKKEDYLYIDDMFRDRFELELQNEIDMSVKKDNYGLYFSDPSELSSNSQTEIFVNVNMKDEN